jgi:hypothetical protein
MIRELIDDDSNITCVIDWAFALSAPESILLDPPRLPQYSDEICSELRMSFIDGFVAAMSGSVEERLIQRYHEMFERSQVTEELSRLLSFDSISEYDLIAALWYTAHGPEKDLGVYFLQQRRLLHYVRLYSEVQEEDQPLSKIEKEEDDCFQNQDIRKTITRKLTLVSKGKAQYTFDRPSRLREDMFVASPKLWRWIHRFVQDWEDMS